MRKQTKATNIPPSVKKAVWERDGECCIICGDPNAGPNAHFIARSHGGKGVERNIVTLCYKCHYNYDQTELRPFYRERIRAYLQSKYPDWDESQLAYKKYQKEWDK